jgi:hypothetical protein
MPALRAKESDVDDLKELLPLAARAMGISDAAARLVVAAGWNPLTPGDGAEMEDKLRISVHRIPDGVCSYVDGAVGLYQRYEMHADHSTEGHARRWASLRVAAAIGRSMK